MSPRIGPSLMPHRRTKKMMCIVTPTNDAAPGAGGVAYLNSFYDGSIDPCWCFNLGDPDTVSHEIGHTFGLRHDGLDSLEYHPGNGTWGPIMGAAFGSSVQTWSIGDYEGNTNTEDDLDIIDARSAKFRDDQYGDSAADGFDLAEETGDVAVGIVGIIETPEDVDVFRFTTSGGTASLRVTPESGNYDNVVNMNMRLQLYNEAGDLLVEDDPENSYAASITTELEAGNYTLHVEGAGSGSPDVSGFSDYGSIGQYGLTGDVEGLGGLIVEINQPQLEEVSIAAGNGLVVAASVTGSADSVMWRATGAPSGGVVTFDDANSKSARASFSAPGLYTLRFRASLDPIFTDKELKVSVETASQPKVYANRGPVVSIDPADLYFSREGLITGRVSDDGVPSTGQPAYEWKVISGTLEVPNIRAQRPNIVFNDNQPSLISLESSDGLIRTFAQAKVQSFFEKRTIVDQRASGRWFIPKNNDLGLGWIDPAFDDSSWNQGPTGFGYDQDSRYSAYIGNGTDLESSMKGQSSSAYLRIPFSLPQLDYVQGLELLVNYNDAFVAYINGVEVARRNAPGGALSWESTAVSVRSQEAALFATQIDLMGVQGILKTGENILAIHGMNNTAEDGDFLVNPVIQAELIASPFFTFLERYGLALDPSELPAGDHDGDNNINLVEHALDTDPTAANGDFYPLQAGSSSNGSIKITLPIDAPEDVDYRIERAREGVEAQNWEVIATKRGPGAWTGNSIFTYIDKKVGGNVTYSLRELNTAPDPSNLRLYRLGYSLRGPGGNAAPN
ncbi:zinc-dependent metalloprotease [Akkermansiaceae bacterium]|nr:zinc-dependent metalloprotease [Akkermansiaceae bacterium]